MIDFKRLRNMKNLQDIKLERAKLRYEVLLAEARLIEDLGAIQSLFTLPAFFVQFKDGLSFAHRMFDGIQNVLGWFFRKKHQPGQSEPSV